MEEKAIQNAFLFLFSLLFLSVSVSAASSPSPNSNTLSLPLYHADQNKHLDLEQLFHLRLQRHAARLKSFTQQGTFTSPIRPGIAEYVTRIGIGTPPRYLDLELDSGSDLTWVQCKPCKNCFNQTNPIFDPTNSTSFAGIPCKSSTCHQLSLAGGCNNTDLCPYTLPYADTSFSSGYLATETLTFGKTTLNRLLIGCGRDNQGFTEKFDGILGINRGILSFVGQTGSRFNNKFSYCLPYPTSKKPSSLIFGDSAIPPTARFTPLLLNPNSSLLYYVELLGISVGAMPVRGISPSQFRINQDGSGGVIIDSGSTVTGLTKLAYVALRDAFRAATTHLKRGPKYDILDTCYVLPSLAEAKVPTVVLHFRGVDLSLPPTNVMVSFRSGLFCFAFVESPFPLSIISNTQQQGIRISYDLAGSRVGFSPGECT